MCVWLFVYLVVVVVIVVVVGCFIVCFSEDDGPGQGGLYQKNHPVAAEWPGFRQTKLSGSQLRIGRGAELSSDKERFSIN